MRKLIILLTLVLIACTETYPQLTMERITRIRDNYYIESGQGEVLDSSNFTLVSVYRKYEIGWTSSTSYHDMKLDLRWYPDSSTAIPAGDFIGELRMYGDYDVIGFVDFLYTKYPEYMSVMAYNFSLIEDYYGEYITEGGTGVITIFKVYLNYENTWYDGSEGSRTLFYNSEWVQFIPLGSTYIDTADNNFNMEYLGEIGIKEGGPISVDGWFDYFGRHKYDPIN